MTETLWPDTVSVAEATAVATQSTDAVIERLLAVPPGLESRVYEAMRYSALAPGKRLRPFLVLASARLFGVARRSALQVAAAIEMVHAYSLIHDDLPAMDDSDLRRGRPTCHKRVRRGDRHPRRRRLVDDGLRGPGRSRHAWRSGGARRAGRVAWPRRPARPAWSAAR